MKSRIKLPVQRAALFNIPAEKAEKIRSLFAADGIEAFMPDISGSNEKIGYLLNVPGYLKSGTDSNASTEKAELIIFADLTEKSLDKALSDLRENGLTVRFKAVLTKHNKDFTYSELMAHMFAEEKQLEIRNKG